MWLTNNKDDKDNKTYGSLDRIPDGFTVEDGTFYNPEGNKVSQSYHDVFEDECVAKMGAIRYELIEKNGFIIPKNKSDKVWNRVLSQIVRGGLDIQEGYLDAIRDHHGECPDSIREKHIRDRLRDTLKERLDNDKYRINSNNKNAENYIDEVADEMESLIDDRKRTSSSIRMVEKDPLEMLTDKIDEDKEEDKNDFDHINTKRVELLIKAYVSGALRRGTDDWDYFWSAYPELMNKIDRISLEDPVKSLNQIEREIEIHLSSELYNDINELIRLRRKNDLEIEERSKKYSELVRELRFSNCRIKE